MIVLKGIPSVLSPELLYTLALMGHGDELGLKIPQLLEAILKLLPLDFHVSHPAAVVDLIERLKIGCSGQPAVWDTYEELLRKAGSQTPLKKMEQFVFYERAKTAFAVVTTWETALYGNLILKKSDLFPSQLQ